MAYSSVRGRKPMERASKISHAEVINNPQVQEFLAHCTLPEPADEAVVSEFTTPVPPPGASRTKLVVAIDGGFQEVPVQPRFPSSTLTFFTFGPLLLQMQDLRELDESPFLAPEDMARLKKIQRYNLVLPTRNISSRGQSLTRSVRDTLHQFFSARREDDPPFYVALRWLLFRGWQSQSQYSWTIPHCPNPQCGNPIVLSASSGDQIPCPACGEPVYLVDALRLHEVIDDDHGAGEILSYLMTTLEQVVLVHVVKLMWELKKAFLRETLFIKDGPLAFFGQTAQLSVPMRELVIFLQNQPYPHQGNGATTSYFNAVGLEKSGAFVDHAVQIDDRLNPGSVLILGNRYIYRYIIPGDENRDRPYGESTYWGSKLIFKAHDGNTYVATVPTTQLKLQPEWDDFVSLDEILSVAGQLRCSMYDNALVPIALANKLVSLSDFPSTRILETFARGQMRAG